MKDMSYKICARCVMDTSAPDITFDERNICNYCNDFLIKAQKTVFLDDEIKIKKLNAFVAKIKLDGKNKRYDCIVGVSGGVDSSWMLVKAVEMGLRPLAVHMDNGWNSELAQNNINNLVKILGVDLYTHVINWQEYKKFMQAFFDADVIDVELLYDNAMLALNYALAKKYRLKYILSGTNQATEGMKIPASWNWLKLDKRNICMIGKKFQQAKLSTFPAIGTLQYFYYCFVKKIQWISMLDLMPYQKFEAIKILQARYRYKPYPYKHYESIFTRFYQGYILPEKFGVDKRKIHFSNLIVTKQIDRDVAIFDLNRLPYPSNQELNDDLNYFLKKMGWSLKQLQTYIKRPGVAHNHYSSEIKLYKFIIHYGLLIKKFFD